MSLTFIDLDRNENRPCPSSSLTLTETKLGPAQNGNRLCPLIRRWPSLPNPGRNRFLDGVLWAALEKVSCRVLLKECVERAYPAIPRNSHNPLGLNSRNASCRVHLKDRVERAFLTFSQSPHERMRVGTRLPTAMGPTHSNGLKRVNVDPRWRRPGHVQGRRPAPGGEASS